LCFTNFVGRGLAPAREFPRRCDFTNIRAFHLRKSLRSFANIKSAICLFPLCFADLFTLFVFVGFFRNCRFYFFIVRLFFSGLMLEPLSLWGKNLLKNGY
jgi:hypothetical protein